MKVWPRDTLKLQNSSKPPGQHVLSIHFLLERMNHSHTDLKGSEGIGVRTFLSSVKRTLHCHYEHPGELFEERDLAREHKIGGRYHVVLTLTFACSLYAQRFMDFSGLSKQSTEPVQWSSCHAVSNELLN